MRETVPMANYKINDEALDDIERIFEYGIEIYGLTAARDFIYQLQDRFQNIANSPLQSPAVDEIRNGYRRNVFKGHSIYFRINNETVEIMAIIGNQDINLRLL